jgi:hypothetical protein
MKNHTRGPVYRSGHAPADQWLPPGGQLEPGERRPDPRCGHCCSIHAPGQKIDSFSLDGLQAARSEDGYGFLHQEKYIQESYIFNNLFGPDNM